MSESTARGCGERAENALYVCVAESPLGMPIEYFLVDPVVAFEGKILRSPMLIRDRFETVHFALGIGKMYYPFVSDFVEEARRVGVSKRVPRNFDPSVLTPAKSKFLLIHPRAIPQFDYDLRDMNNCPKNLKEPHRCIGHLWDLSSLKEYGHVHELSVKREKGKRKLEFILVRTPSAAYAVNKPLHAAKPHSYATGIILAFNTFRFEYVNRNRKVPKKVKQSIIDAGFSLEVKET